MRKSKTLAKIRAGKPVRMCALGHFNPAYVQQAALHKFDCIWLDMEHRMIDPREVQSLMAFFHMADIDCMLRAPTLEKTQLYRYLEDGATGLMIPHVATAEKARMLVDATKFPPIGGRGLDGAGLDTDFMQHSLEDYVAHANRETFLVVQIESPEAVDNVDEIAAVEGVDGMFVGPGDLGLRINCDPENLLSLEASIEKVAQAAKRHGKAWGIPGATAEIVEEFYQQGAQLVNFGGDFGAFVNMFKDHSQQLDRVYPAD